MIIGTTSTGFQYNIDKRRLENYEVVESLAELEDNPLILPKIVKLILGDNVNALKEHCRDENGFVSTEKMTAELTEIFQSKQLKK